MIWTKRWCSIVKFDDPKIERLPIKKALIVGINKYDPLLNADLMGCVNDAENMRDILIRLYGFDPDNIRLVIDSRATRKGIVDRLRWLVNDSVEGDELVFHYSGHGSQVRDRNDDELNDHLDEILCPHNLDWENPLTDDILARFFNRVVPGANLTMICDSCHSGTMSREINPMGNPSPQVYNKPRFVMPPLDIRTRSMGRNMERKKVGRGQDHVLISGCKDNQTSADAYIDNKYQGAFTWALLKAIKENPNNSSKHIHERVQELLRGKFSQIPQLGGKRDLINRPIFGGTK